MSGNTIVNVTCPHGIAYRLVCRRRCSFGAAATGAAVVGVAALAAAAGRAGTVTGETSRKARVHFDTWYVVTILNVPYISD